MSKIKFISALAILSVAMFSCSDPKENALKELRALNEDVTSNSKNYTIKDWEEYIDKYQHADSVIELYEYNAEEKKEIRKLQSRCAAYVLKAGMHIATDRIGSAVSNTQQVVGNAANVATELINGVVDGINESSENIESHKQDVENLVKDNIDKAKDALEGFSEALKEE